MIHQSYNIFIDMSHKLVLCFDHDINRKIIREVTSFTEHNISERCGRIVPERDVQQRTNEPTKQV